MATDKKHTPKQPIKETVNYLFIYNFNFGFTPRPVIVSFREKKKKKTCCLSCSVFLSLASADFPFLGNQHSSVQLNCFLE